VTEKTPPRVVLTAHVHATPSSLIDVENCQIRQPDALIATDRFLPMRDMAVAHGRLQTTS